MIKAQLLNNFKHQLEDAYNYSKKAYEYTSDQLQDVAVELNTIYDSLVEDYDNLQSSGVDTSSIDEKFSITTSNLLSAMNLAGILF